MIIRKLACLNTAALFDIISTSLWNEHIIRTNNLKELKMTAYLIAQCTIENRQLYDEYIDRLVPILGRYKAKILSVDEAPEIMDGNIECNKVAVVEFESKQIVMELYNSPEYQAILPIRRKAIPGVFTVIEGLNI